MCVCCPSGVVGKKVETPYETCTYVVESCSIRGHHMLTDFCTPVINKACSGSKEEKFGGRTCAQKNSSCCLLFLWTVTLTATVTDSHQYSNDLLQGGLEDSLHFFVYVRSLAEAGAVITNSTLIRGNFFTAATPFSNCSVTQRKRHVH